MSDTIPESAPQFKQCYACGETFPATKQFFQSHNQKKDGLSPRCKTCISTGRKPYERDIIPDGKKRCTKCREVFDATSEFFHKHSKIKSGLNPACKTCANAETRIYEATHVEERQQYRNDHREERNAKQRQRNKENKEENRQKARLRYQLRKDEVCAKRKAYVKANKDEVYKRNNIYRQEHSEELKQYNREYAKTDHGRVVYRAARHKRKALKKATPGTLTADQIQAKLKAQKNKCYYCFTKFEKVKGQYVFHLEHTIPLSRTEHNPRHDENFIVLACPTCNLKKHNRLPSEWPEGGRLF